MSITPGFVQEVDHTSREQWEEILKKELKLSDVATKTNKNSPDGPWPTLSLSTTNNVQIPLTTAWKKAAQTYIGLPKNFHQVIEEDLAGGVRCFFIEKDFMTQSQLDDFIASLEKFHTPAELDVFLLGDEELKTNSSVIHVTDEAQMMTGRLAFDAGGNNVQELGLMARNLIDCLDDKNKHFTIGIFAGPHFFRNIAKIRAAKLLVTKILKESGSHATFSVVSLTSYREWTMYERYSNILRNDVSVASSYIAGADVVQSSGYQALFALEAGLFHDDEHSERSLRMARNTSHILALESMLGVVGDAAFGSYHLETLTESLCQEAWTFMQKLVPLSEQLTEMKVLSEATTVREERRKQINTRKLIMAGTNDFPDVKDKLGHIRANKRFFRLAHDFEEIRLQTEGFRNPPKVFIALYGDVSALNARINFVRNYFELIGLEVTDPSHSVTDIKVFTESLKHHEKDIVVLLSSDEQYANIMPIVVDLKAREKYVAGKTEVTGFMNLFAGQNVYNVLTNLILKWS